MGNAVQTVILIDWPSRCMYFGIGVALWIVTLAIMYLAYLCSKEYCCGSNDDLSEESEQLMNDKERKQHIEATSHAIINGKEEIELVPQDSLPRKGSTQASSSSASDETYSTQSTTGTTTESASRTLSQSQSQTETD